MSTPHAFAPAPTRPRRIVRVTRKPPLPRMSFCASLLYPAVILAATLALFPNSTAAAPRQTLPPPAVVATTQQPEARPSPAAATAATANAAEEQAARREKSVRAPGSLTGRVVADDGRPLAGATVNLWRRGGAGRPAGSVAADEAGRFRFDNLEPGVYTLNAWLPGYVTAPDPLAERGAAVFQRVGSDVRLTLQKGGVLTGMVTDADGTPIVAVHVRAARLRDPDGTSRNQDGAPFVAERETDDRGVYRLFGLPPGVYVIYAGGAARNFAPLPGPFDVDVPTYFPSSTRDTASEVTVHAGQEVGGLDIRYRGERGHAVSGRIEGAEAPENSGFAATLVDAATGTTLVNDTPRGFGEDTRSFSFEGVPDGDYDLSARTFSRGGDNLVSAPQRVSVRGADVTGLRLALAPLASISGHVRLEPTAGAENLKEACRDVGRGADALPQEAVVVARRDEAPVPAAASSNQPRARATRADSVPDAQGEFTLRNLEAGRYRLEAVPPGPDWFVRSVALAGRAATSTPRAQAAASKKEEKERKEAAPRAPGRIAPAAPTVSTVESPVTEVTPPPANAGAAGALALKPGERVSGVVVTFARGAARLSGHVTSGEGNERQEQRNSLTSLRAHLVPAERERAEDELRYAESAVAPDGAFAFAHLAPGRYLLLVRPNVSDPRRATPQPPAAWDAASRARLRREAEAANIVVELRPCQQLEGFSLRR